MSTAMDYGRSHLEHADIGATVPVYGHWPIDGTLVERHDDGSVTIRVPVHYIRATWDASWEGFEDDDSPRDEHLNR